MPENLNVSILNLNTSLSIDTFEIYDNVLGGALIANPTIRGGESYPFSIADDGTGNGDLNIVNVAVGTPIHYSFIKDGDEIKI